MSRRIIRSDLAIADLAEHAEYIRQHNPLAAIRFLDAAEATFRQLANIPGDWRGCTRPEPPLSRTPLHASISKFPNHIIYYKALPDGIVVYRVLHASRRS